MNHHRGSGLPPTKDRFGRTQLTLAQFAQRLDHRLHEPHVQTADLEAGCRFALENGVAAVTCRPEHVTDVARLLDGSGIGVVTALDVNRPRPPGTPRHDWTAEACELAGHGASELAVVATADDLSPGARGPFLDGLNRLLTLQDVDRFRVRVHVDAAGVTDEQLAAATRDFGEAGVWMVQVGAWTNQKAAFRSLLLIREALGREVLLKWTTPVPSHQVMLLAIAEGVDRFNGDVPELLRAWPRA